MGIDRLLGASWDYRAARALQVAVKLDLFTRLKNTSATARDVAAECQSKPDMTEKLMIVCTAMGLLEQRNGLYSNTELAEKYLVRGRENYQGDMIIHSARVWNFWHALPDDIYEVKPPELSEQESHRNFILAMHNIARSGRAARLANAVDLSGRKRLLDVGGGPGTYSMELCRKTPGLRATIFDLPETTAIAREVIQAEGMEDRVSVREADWNTDDFGEGYDVVLMSNVLHGQGSKSDMKLAKAYAALVKTGLLVVQDFVLNEQKTGPLKPALFNVMVGAYSKDELFAELERAGFAQPNIIMPQEDEESEDNSIVTAVKP